MSKIRLDQYLCQNGLVQSLSLIHISEPTRH